MFQLRSMLAAGQRQPQGVEQRLALAAGGGLQAVDPGRKPVGRDPAAELGRDRQNGGSSTTGASGRRHTSHHSRASSSRARLPRIASQNAASMPASPCSRRRGATSAKAGGAGRPPRSAAGRRPAAWAAPGHSPPSEKPATSSSSRGPDRRHARCRAPPGSRRWPGARCPARAGCAGSRHPAAWRTAGRPHRAISGRWAKRGGGAPVPARIASWSAVLLTWSSPRMTWLIPSSASSTAEANR